MKLARLELINGSLPHQPHPHESWDFGLPPSTSMNPIFHSFNLDSHELPNTWFDPITNSPESMEPSPDGGELHVLAENGRNKSVEESGLTLINHLFDCAVAISVGNLAEAHRMLLELSQMASPYAPSSGERVVSYFAMAMCSRVMNSILGICSLSPPLVNFTALNNAFQLFGSISPFLKSAYSASNQAILEALSGLRDPIHIVDLDITNGLQWPPLLRALAAENGARRVRLTAMGASMEVLHQIGNRLCDIAQRLGIAFEYNPIEGRAGQLDESMIHRRHGEALAVNLLQHRLYDATGSDWNAIRLIQHLRPEIFTLVEQESSHGVGDAFLERFVSAIHYYAAIFDSLEACKGGDGDGDRKEVEQGVLYREINNVLAMGGPWRSGEEKVGQWRSEVRKWMKEVPMSGDAMDEARMVLRMCPNNEDGDGDGDGGGYSAGKGEGGTFKIGWEETCLYTVSAWTCYAAVAPYSLYTI